MTVYNFKEVTFSNEIEKKTMMIISLLIQALDPTEIVVDCPLQCEQFHLNISSRETS